MERQDLHQAVEAAFNNGDLDALVALYEPDAAWCGRPVRPPAELGQDGVAELVDRRCTLARRFAEQLDGVQGAEVVEAVQQSGGAGRGVRPWHGMALMWISASNWSTTEADVDRSLRAILTAARGT